MHLFICIMTRALQDLAFSEYLFLIQLQSMGAKGGFEIL